MTLFSLLLVLGWERLFKVGKHWQLEHRLEPLFRWQKRFLLSHTLFMVVLTMACVLIVIQSLHGLFFGVPLLLFWIITGLLCIGAGSVRRHYQAYLRGASAGDSHACKAMRSELMQIHGVPPGCDEQTYLRELQNALLWINYRFYLAPMFWLVIGGFWGPILLTGYAVLRAWQGWLACHQTSQARKNSGVDILLHWLDWLPVRLAGVAYALAGKGEQALPAWFASLSDYRTPPYQVLTQLAQFALMRDPHTDSVETPQRAVTLAKRVSLILVVAVALLTIYGALV
ncbi:beta-lactamase regulator AmpE [Enterobacteriaceae bacterium LUAb1]